ncbi:MAG: TonB-dependent receptor [Hyphomonadaceae bacterium]|nr:TonB-dependent receptor [Hyphomonadaceae bacterium]
MSSRALFLLGVGAGALMFSAFSADVAHAQEGVSDADALVVTGSRIQRRDALSVGPLTTLTAQDIEAVAPTSLGDLLQTLPSVGVSLNSNGTQGTAFGSSSINLRYLGSAEGSGNRTLVLVDGRRWVNAVGGRGFRDFVDLNTIPLGLVERIEVLKDGASAIYGADAIAGVVNVHTRQNVEGFQINLRAGQTSEGDNENISGYVNWGGSWDRLSVLASVSYSDTGELLTSDRALTARALTPLTAPPSSPRGLYVLPGLNSNVYFGTAAAFGNNQANAITRLPGVTTIGAGAAADNSFRVATLPADDYNTMTQGIYATGPSERFGAFGRIAYEVSPTLTATFEALYSTRSSSQLFSPVLLDVRGSNGFGISADQAYNPFGTANGVPVGNALAFTSSAFRAQRVMEEVGNRNNVQDIETTRFLAALEGSFALMGEWNWDAHVSYSRNEATFIAYNQVNLQNVYSALRSPATCAAAPGCTPLNIFGVITPQMANYIRFNGHDEQTAEQFDFAANVSRTLFSLPGGPVGFAAGYEYRRESAEDLPDAFANSLSTVLPLVSGAAQLPTTAQARDPTSGSYNLQEVYAEVNLPLLTNAPLVYSLDVDLAARYSDYSTVGDRTTGKIGVAWRPVSDLLVRATFSQGFRAPSILELYQGSRQTNFQAVDPCNGGGAGRPGCAGIPVTYNQNLYGSGAIAGVTAGNPNLEAETSETVALGLAFTPAALPGLSFTMDWFRIDVEDAIASQTATQILQSCANRLVYCDLVNRAATGEVLELRQAVVNLASIEVEGVDAGARYQFDTGIGDFEASLDVSYLERYRTSIPQPDGSILVDDRAGLSNQPRSTFPRWKAQAGLRWDSGPWSAGWRIRYIGESEDVPGNAVNGGTIRAITYNDVQLGYEFAEPNVSLTFGVDNVGDTQPPASAANNPINFDIYTYDIRGRYFYGRVGLRF